MSSSPVLGTKRARWLWAKSSLTTLEIACTHRHTYKVHNGKPQYGNMFLLRICNLNRYLQYISNSKHLILSKNYCSKHKTGAWNKTFWNISNSKWDVLNSSWFKLVLHIYLVKLILHCLFHNWYYNWRGKIHQTNKYQSFKSIQLWE